MGYTSTVTRTEEVDTDKAPGISCCWASSSWKPSSQEWVSVSPDTSKSTWAEDTVLTRLVGPLTTTWDGLREDTEYQ